MSRRALIVGSLLVLGGVGWYAFRPERLWINQTVNEELPNVAGRQSAGASSSATLLSGQFHSNAHPTSGAATILRLADGKQVLRLTDFQTSNGPDVQVYLVAANDVTDNETVKRAGFVSLGALKGNIGDQNYELPAGVDLNTHRTVTIWCRRFGVNFGSAPLSTASAMRAESPTAAIIIGGRFHSNAHETRGVAAIHQLSDGSRILRLSDFRTSNGPDVQVYLVAATDVNDNETVTRAGFINVGALKGNIGDQNYEVPADVDLSKYRAVTIWCRRFGVNFGTAPLAAPQS